MRKTSYLLKRGGDQIQFENVTFLPVFVLFTEWSLLVSVKTLARDVLKSVFFLETKHDVS